MRSVESVRTKQPNGDRCSEIGVDGHTQAEEAVVLIERELSTRAVVAALIVRDESLGAVLLPLHRPRKLAARERSTKACVIRGRIMSSV